ncbi:MAG: hypothetical protein F4236_06460 [Acidimicrobiia bacterium]|nr:hypothetical protein [Acidimicrobiia bacterium]MYE67782.1 hypothetical protein [Acidimicrobiia bacterium]MYJ14243.1 hypothetical protein [Acidimicrobiia bacterium]
MAGRRTRPGQLRRVGLRVALVLLGGLFAVGVLQAVVTQAQGRIDQLDQQIDEAVSLDRELRLRRAELLSPARLASEARDRLGMVPPATVIYLDPATPPAP